MTGATLADITTRGRIVWHSSAFGVGPDCGISVGLGEGCAIYCGVVKNKTGWWLTFLEHDDTAEIAKVEDPEAARVLIERLADIVTPNRDTAYPAGLENLMQPDGETLLAGYRALPPGRRPSLTEIEDILRAAGRSLAERS